MQTSPSQDDSPGSVLHLWAAVAALGVTILLVSVARVEVRRQLRVHLEAVASSLSAMKMHGNLLQRSAFSNSGTLPIYGSSELDQPAGNRPDVFYRLRPTGFTVFAEGHAGTTCLMIMQKIAAAGRVARGKKTVIFLSPSWFARPEVAEHTVTANLPAAQLSAWIFDSPLSRSLKEKLARRLQNYPEATKDQPLLTAAVRTLARRTAKDRCVFAGLWALGKCQDELALSLESETLLWEMWGYSRRSRREGSVSGKVEKASPPRQAPDWPELARRAEDQDRARNDGTVYSVTSPRAADSTRMARINAQLPGSRDAEFTTKLRKAEEWHDLKLMTEILKDLGIHALFISQPINGKYYDLGGVTSRARQVYYKKLANLIRPSGFPLREYVEWEEDRFFFNDSGHPSAKAWINYDQALDQFYHQSLR